VSQPVDLTHKHFDRLIKAEALLDRCLDAAARYETRNISANEKFDYQHQQRNKYERGETWSRLVLNVSNAAHALASIRNAPP